MSSDDRLEALDSLLLSVTDEGGMLLSEFGGLCAGVIVCPDLIPPCEWMPLFWGANGMPQFASENGLQKALDLVVSPSALGDESSGAFGLPCD
jgi:uncharacterized protein